MTQTQNQQILDEAAAWFVECREGDMDAASEKVFNQWLRRSPEHIAAYLEVAAFWVDVGNVAEKDDLNVQALVAYALAEDNIVPLVTARRAARDESTAPISSVSNQTLKDRVRFSALAATRSLTWRSPWRDVLAASLVIALAGITVWNVRRHDIYSTDIGEQRSVLLEDGSVVELNTQSRLRVHFTDGVREMDLLEGQALFKVTKDPRRPFVVNSGDVRTRAVGTQFDVYRKKSGTVVTVVEGTVAVLESPAPTSMLSSSLDDKRGKPDVNTVMLSAGEQLVVDKKASPRPAPADIPVATAWTQRQIIFQNASLEEVVQEFNRYNPRPMELSDEPLRAVRISGVFSSTEPASLLRFLHEQVHLKITESNEGTRISQQ